MQMANDLLARYLENKTWTIPGAGMKAGVDRSAPLSPRCIEIQERDTAVGGFRRHGNGQ